MVTNKMKLKQLLIIYQQKWANTIATNVMSVASINYHSKKVRYCHIFSPVFILLILV